MPDAQDSGSVTRKSLRPLLSVFWSTLAVFLLLISFIFAQQYIPDSSRYFTYIFFPGVALLTVLGIVLIVMAARARVIKSFRLSMMFTGISAVGMPVSAILHNVVYGLMIYIFGRDFWENMGGGDEAVFFILALIVFPAVLIVSAICAVVIYIRAGKAVSL